MEDAMILNKGSHERGFAHACIYKSEVSLNLIFINYMLAFHHCFIWS